MLLSLGKGRSGRVLAICRAWSSAQPTIHDRQVHLVGRRGFVWCAQPSRSSPDWHRQTWPNNAASPVGADPVDRLSVQFRRGSRSAWETLKGILAGTRHVSRNRVRCGQRHRPRLQHHWRTLVARNAEEPAPANHYGELDQVADALAWWAVTKRVVFQVRRTLLLHPSPKRLGDLLIS